MEHFNLDDLKEYDALLEHYFSSREGFSKIISQTRFKELEQKFLGMNVKSMLIEALDKSNARIASLEAQLEKAEKVIEKTMNFPMLQGESGHLLREYFAEKEKNEKR